MNKFEASRLENSIIFCFNHGVDKKRILSILLNFDFQVISKHGRCGLGFFELISRTELGFDEKVFGYFNKKFEHFLSLDYLEFDDSYFSKNSLDRLKDCIVNPGPLNIGNVKDHLTLASEFDMEDFESSLFAKAMSRPLDI